jgi:hypothetical protein
VNLSSEEGENKDGLEEVALADQTSHERSLRTIFQHRRYKRIKCYLLIYMYDWAWWWHAYNSSTLRQEDCEFKASLYYTVRPCLRKKKKKRLVKWNDSSGKWKPLSTIKQNKTKPLNK